jgi:hypothetical protein
MSELDLARIDAVSRYFRARLGESGGQAKVATLRTFDDLRNAEQEIAAALPSLRNAVMAPASPRPAAAPASETQAGDRVSEEQYARMTSAERLDYARRFPQPNNGGGPRR